MTNHFQYFLGIDWGSERHRVCLMNREGRTVAERWIEHSGQSLAELVAWLLQQTSDSASALAGAIESPRGAVVETLLEHGFAVFSINPKQLDRFRDRYSPAAAQSAPPTPLTPLTPPTPLPLSYPPSHRNSSDLPILKPSAILRPPLGGRRRLGLNSG